MIYDDLAYYSLNTNEKDFILTMPDFKLYFYRFEYKMLGVIVQEYDNYFHFSGIGFPKVFENIETFMTRINVNSYHEIPISTYQNIFENLKDSWFYKEDDLIPFLIKYLRDIRIKNEYISDEENNFLNWLGFDKFYPSRHIVIDKIGYIPIE